MSTSTETKALPTGFDTTLTPQQREGLTKLRERIEKSEFAADLAREPESDRFLLRFLRATMKDKHGERIFQVQAAEERLLSSFKWRREHNVEAVRKNIAEGGPPPNKYELFLGANPKLDVVNESTGAVVRFLRFSRFIATVDPSMMTTDEWIECLTYECVVLEEKLRALSKQYGREISTYVVVSDMVGVSFYSVATKSSFIKLITHVLSDNFPEILGQTILIRAPIMVSTIFNIVRPFIDKDIQSKFVFASDVPLDLITRLIPLSLVPKEYGGLNEDTLPLVRADAEKLAIPNKQ